MDGAVVQEGWILDSLGMADGWARGRELDGWVSVADTSPDFSTGHRNGIKWDDGLVVRRGLPPLALREPQHERPHRRGWIPLPSQGQALPPQE